MAGITDDVVSKLDIVGYYSKHLQWKSKANPKNWMALCPFHQETDGSLSVEITDGLFTCHGCGKSGNIVEFQKLISNQSTNEALRELAQQAGIELPEKRKPGRPKGSTTNKPTLSEETANKMHSELTDEMREYLHGRGVSDEIIDKNKLGVWKGYLVFPIYKRGRLHTYRFKSLKEKRIWQLSKQDIGGNDPVWIFPEPNPEENEIFIVEGEIDALNCRSMGIHACTVTGGAGTFREELLPLFEEKKVFVCYDIDEAGRVGSKNVARHVAQVAKEARIIQLDLDAKEYPGGDINDYFVAKKKTKDDLYALAENSEIVVKVDSSISVVEDSGCYWSFYEKKNGEVVANKITDFVIRLKCRYRQQDGTVIREIVLISNVDGRVSASFMVLSAELTTVRSFTEFVVSAGKFYFWGSHKNLMDILRLVEAQDPNANEVHSYFKIGHIEKPNVWVFDNMVISPPNVFMPDKNGICWNGSKGYMATPIEIQGEDLNNIVPRLKTSDGPTNGMMQEYSSVMMKNIGTYDCLHGLGIACGSIYFKEILHEFGCFPILWVYGKLRCGKNEYVGFLMRMFGLGRTDCESLPGIRSTVPVTRKLSYYSSIPVWFDEFRNSNRNNAEIKGVFRSAYNGSGRSLGLKATKGIHSERTHAPIIVSGEELPEDDEALISRLIVVNLKLKYRKDEHYNEVFNMSQDTSKHIFNIIKGKNGDSCSGLIKTIKEAQSRIKSNVPNMNSRVILNYAISCGCYRYLVCPDDDLYWDYITSGQAMVGRRDYEEDESGQPIGVMLSDFFEGCNSVVSQGALRNVGWYRIDGDHVYIWFQPLHSAWAEHYRRITGDKPPNNRTVIDHIREAPFFIDSNVKYRIKDRNTEKMHVRSCIVLDMTKMSEVTRCLFGEDKYEYNTMD